MAHPGAVAMLARDGDALLLVRQPREAVGEEALLELPAGKLDEGEDPLATAKRELAEEIGKGARTVGAGQELLHLARVHRRGVPHLPGRGPATTSRRRRRRTSASRSWRCRSTGSTTRSRSAATPRPSSACSGCAPTCSDQDVAAAGDAGRVAEPVRRGHRSRRLPRSQRIEQLVLDFLAYLEFERGLSRNTLEAYRSDLLQYGRFLAERHVSAIDASSADVADFLTALGHGRGRRPSRRRRPRSTARPPACAPSTATCAATGCASRTPPPR